MSKTKAEIQREYEKRTGYAAQIKYAKEKTKSICLRFSPLEMGMYNFLRSQPNQSGYLKNLILKDMQKQEKGSF